MIKQLIFCLFSIAHLSAIEFGAQDMVSELKTVIVKRPDRAFDVADPKKWHYTSQPNLKKAQKEHDQFVSIMKKEGVEVVYHDKLYPELADAIYVHDPVLITDKGAILLRMGKELRRGEVAAIEEKLQEMEVPILYRLHGEATAEGGDCLFLDQHTLAVGHGYRTNAEGIRQLREALEPLGVTVVAVPLPYWEGKEACLHLMSLISLVDVNKAVVYKPLLPVPFVQLLEEKGYQFIEVPKKEFLTMGPNVLAIRPGTVVALKGNPTTRHRMKKAGLKVHTYQGVDVSLKAEGGPTCLTRPLKRLYRIKLKNRFLSLPVSCSLNPPASHLPLGRCCFGAG